MALKIGVTSQQAACDAVVDLIDAGGAGAGTIEVRTGSQPANPAASATGTLLVTFTCATTAFGSANGSGVATLASTPLSATAGNTGTAGWFRIKDSAGVAIMDGACGAGSGELSLSTTSIVSGATVEVTSGTVTMPGA